MLYDYITYDDIQCMTYYDMMYYNTLYYPCLGVLLPLLLHLLAAVGLRAVAGALVLLLSPLPGIGSAQVRAQDDRA